MAKAKTKAKSTKKKTLLAKRLTSEPSESALKKQMCEIGHRMWLRGFCGGNEGNISTRMPGDRILCTPTAMSKGFMTPGDLCIVDIEGKQLSGTRRTTTEILMHLFIYRNRPDVTAVIHTHAPHATAFAIAGIDLPTCIHPEAEVFLGPVKTAPYVTPGDTRLGESLAPYVADSSTILLGNHGTVSFAKDLEIAFYKLEIIDAYARMLILARQLGRIQPISEEYMRELISIKPRYGQNDPRVAPDGTITGLTPDGDYVPSFEADFASSKRTSRSE